MSRTIFQVGYMDDFDQALDEPPDDNDFGVGAGQPIAIDESVDEMNDETFGIGEQGGDWEADHEVLVKAEMETRHFSEIGEIAEVEEHNELAIRAARLPFESRPGRSYTYSEGLPSGSGRFDDETQFLRVEQTVSQIFDDSSDEDDAAEVINLEDEEVSAINGHRPMRTQSESQSQFCDPAIIASASGAPQVANAAQPASAADMQRITAQFGALFAGPGFSNANANRGVAQVPANNSSFPLADSAAPNNAPIAFTSFSEFLKSVQSTPARDRTNNQQAPNNENQVTPSQDATVPIAFAANERRGRGRERVLQSSSDGTAAQLPFPAFPSSSNPPDNNRQVPPAAIPPASAQQVKPQTRPSKTRFGAPTSSNGVIAMRAGAGQHQPQPGPPLGGPLPPQYMMPPPGLPSGPVPMGPPPLLGPFPNGPGPGPIPFNGPPLGFQAYRNGPPNWAGPPPMGAPPLPGNPGQFPPRMRNMPPQPPSWARYWERQARLQGPPGPPFNNTPPQSAYPGAPGFPPPFSAPQSQFPLGMLPNNASSPMRPGAPFPSAPPNGTPYGSHTHFPFPRRIQNHRSASESETEPTGPPFTLLRRPDTARGTGPLPPPFAAFSSGTIAIGTSNSHRSFPRNADQYGGLMTQRDRDWVIKVQLSQLNTLNNYADDYYYVQWRMRKLNSTAGARLILPINMAESDSVAPARDESIPQNASLFDGALGKVTKSSIHNPRRVIDIDVPVSGALDESLKVIEARLPTLREALAAARAEVSETGELRRLRRLLLEIEQLLELVLEIEDTEYKLHGLPRDRHAEVLGLKEQRIAALIDRLSLLAKHGLLAVQKGRTLVSRASRLLDACQIERLLALLSESAHESVSLSPDIAKFVDSLLSELSAKQDDGSS